MPKYPGWLRAGHADKAGNQQIAWQATIQQPGQDKLAVKVGAVLVQAARVAAASRVLAVLADTSVTGGNVSLRARVGGERGKWGPADGVVSQSTMVVKVITHRSVVWNSS